MPWLPAALVLLAAAGCADVISAVFRSTIIQLAVPDALRGRLAGLQIAVVTGGPRIGDLESGSVAAAFGDTVSVVSGGLACIAGALVLARVLPGFRRQRISAIPAQEAQVTGDPAGLTAVTHQRQGLYGSSRFPAVRPVWPPGHPSMRAVRLRLRRSLAESRWRRAVRDGISLAHRTAVLLAA